MRTERSGFSPVLLLWRERSSFLATVLCAVILCAVAGCTASAPRPSLAGSSTTEPPVQAVCQSGAEFVANKVRHLRAFRYSRNGYDDPIRRIGYVPPDWEPAPAGPRTQLLADAFGVLPKFVQQRLCRDVTWVFIDDEAANFPGDGTDARGWAFWEVTHTEVNEYPDAPHDFGVGSDQGSGRGHYIGISTAFLDSGQTLAQVETSTTFGLLGLDPSHPPAGFPPLVEYVRPDSPAIATAAVLLHEIGHLTWHDRCFPVETTACKRFLDMDWRNRGHWPASGIHGLGTDLAAQRIDSAELRAAPVTARMRAATVTAPTGIADIVADKTGRRLLRYLGLSGASAVPWASLLAGVSPDEDFAETFKFLALGECGIAVTVGAPSVGPSHVAANLGGKASALKDATAIWPAAGACSR